METDDKKSGWGGKRSGAGRPRTPHNPRKKIARQVTLAPEIWALVDAAQASSGQSRTEIFEHLIRTNLG